MDLHPVAQHRDDADKRQARRAHEQLVQISKNQQDDIEIANCMLMINKCHQMLANVEREQDLDTKHNILQTLFNKIRSCAKHCKLFSQFMRDKIKNLMAEYDKTNAEFNKAVDEHNARLDADDAKREKSYNNFVSMMQETSSSVDPFFGPNGGSRRRNKKSKNSKKRSKKSRKTKSRRH